MLSPFSDIEKCGRSINIWSVHSSLLYVHANLFFLKTTFSNYYYYNYYYYYIYSLNNPISNIFI